MSEETKNNAVPSKPITEGEKNSQPSPSPHGTEIIKGTQLQQPSPVPSGGEEIKGLQLKQPSPPPIQTSENRFISNLTGEAKPLHNAITFLFW